MLFENRREAGRRLAAALSGYGAARDLIVLGLPRGGMPVACEVAAALGAPMDALIVRKLGVPWQPELAMGAIATGGLRVLNHAVIAALGVSPTAIAEVCAHEERELARRDTAFRGTKPPVVASGRTVLLVDDGLATGATMRAAVAALRTQSPAMTIVAVPVGARSTCAALAAEVDALYCLEEREPLNAVGLWYRDFAQTTDAEVVALLAEDACRAAKRSEPAKWRSRE